MAAVTSPQLSSMEDLARAMEPVKALVTAESVGTLQRAGYLSNLGIFLITMYKMTGSA
jgi:hypothetical protein